MKVDADLNICPKAWAILHLLQDYEMDDVKGAHITSAALYNGRERGIVISAGNYFSKRECLHIFFTENRNSDDIVVLTWLGGKGINPPTINDIPESAWDKKKSFNFLDVGMAASYIYAMIKFETAGVK